MGRYALLLCRASSQATAAAAARLPPPVVGASGVQRAQSLQWVTERLMCERRTIPKDESVADTLIHPHTQLDELVDKAVNPESILEAWELFGGNGHQASQALSKWSLLMFKRDGRFKELPLELRTDRRLQNMMDTLSKEVRKPNKWTSNGYLVQVLECACY